MWSGQEVRFVWGEGGNRGREGCAARVGGSGISEGADGGGAMVGMGTPLGWMMQAGGVVGGWGVM